MMTTKTPVFAAGLFLSLAGCSHPKPPSIVNSPLTVTTDKQQTFQMSLTISPAPVRQMDLSVFTVRLTGAARKPMKAANVVVELTMPTMVMPENIVETHAEAVGTWVGAGRFTMAGEWRATVTVTQNGRKTTQSFPITVQ